MASPTSRSKGVDVMEQTDAKLQEQMVRAARRRRLPRTREIWARRRDGLGKSRQLVLLRGSFRVNCHAGHGDSTGHKGVATRSGAIGLLAMRITRHCVPFRFLDGEALLVSDDAFPD